MKSQIETQLVHVSGGHDSGFLNPPIQKGSTVLYRSVAEMIATESDPLKRQAPAYGRFGTSTTRAFEAALAELEGGFAATTTSSGLSAITTAIQAFVEAGDHVLVAATVYQPTRNFCDSLRRFGIETEYYDPLIDGAGLEKKIRANTRLAFFESPGSNTFAIQDIPGLSAACRKRGVITLIDNTWATPVFFNPLKHGVDVCIHSVTKYIGGHSDVIMGAIVCNEQTYAAVRRSAIRLGQCANSEDAYMALRGLRTLHLRLKQHEQQALELATWLRARPEVQAVLHPVFSEHPGHAEWRRDFHGSSGLFSIVLRDFARPHVVAMIESLKYFGLGHSWGGVESLLAPIVTPLGLVLRIHAGLERIDDLTADLAQAMRHLS